MFTLQRSCAAVIRARTAQHAWKSLGKRLTFAAAVMVSKAKTAKKVSIEFLICEKIRKT